MFERWSILGINAKELLLSSLPMACQYRYCAHVELSSYTCSLSALYVAYKQCNAMERLDTTMSQHCKLSVLSGKIVASGYSFSLHGNIPYRNLSA